MSVDDVLSDAMSGMDHYLNDDFYEFDDEIRADIEWLKRRMTEMMAFLQAMPGYDQPKPQFRKRFGEKPLSPNPGSST